MVQKSVMAVKMKQDGEREVTIVNPAENNEDFMNFALGDCEDSVYDEDDSLDSDEVMVDRFYVHKHGETLVLGLLDVIDITIFDNSRESLNRIMKPRDDKSTCQNSECGSSVFM
jgi:hypothetical protein